MAFMKPAAPGAAPPAAAAPAAVNGSGVRKLALKKPIVTHDGSIRELTFRPVTAELAIKYGKLPFEFKSVSEDGQTGTFTFDYKIAAKWIADLTGHDEMVLGQMEMTDFIAACALVRDMVAGVGN